MFRLILCVLMLFAGLADCSACGVAVQSVPVAQASYGVAACDVPLAAPAFLPPSYSPVAVSTVSYGAVAVQPVSVVAVADHHRDGIISRIHRNRVAVREARRGHVAVRVHHHR